MMRDRRCPHAVRGVLRRRDAARPRRGTRVRCDRPPTADTLDRMVTVRVDADLCVGHGRCYVLAPDVFGTDEFGHCVVLEEQVADALAADARIGADNCPEQAITIE